MHFLIGRRDAILAISRDCRWLWCGLLFVIAAGLAREYDAEYLVAEPWYLAIPIAASLVASFLLYGLLRIVFRRGDATRTPYFAGYLKFLTVFWATAPLALVYAIPVERFMSEYNAAVANLWLLAIVALWRIVLTTRFVSVLFGVPARAAFFPVMLFADASALVGLALSPQPLFSFMGGIRLSPTELLVRSTHLLAVEACVLTGLIWIIGTYIACSFDPDTPSESSAINPNIPQSTPPIIWTCLTIAAFLALLPSTQPEQRLRWLVERDLADGKIENALRTMSGHSRNEFPPYFDPRPRNYVGETTPPILDVVRVMATTQTAPWARAIFLAKFELALDRSLPWLDDLGTLVPVLETLPEGPKLAQGLCEGSYINELLDRMMNREQATFVIRLRALANSTTPAGKD